MVVLATDANYKQSLEVGIKCCAELGRPLLENPTFMSVAEIIGKVDEILRRTPLDKLSESMAEVSGIRTSIKHPVLTTSIPRSR